MSFSCTRKVRPKDDCLHDWQQPYAESILRDETYIVLSHEWCPACDGTRIVKSEHPYP